MDTTNHSFSWQTYQLGDGSSGSTLFDAAIINDTLAYAVGQIYRNDTLYGAAKWNGTDWKLIIVPAHDYGSTSLRPAQVRTIWAFNDNSIYVATYANLLKWNGQEWSEKAFFMTGIPFTGQVSKIWATSEQNIYCVGSAGAIYEFNGSLWTKMSSGTDIDLTDIYGSPDGSTVWACGWEDSRYGTYLLRYHGTTWQTAYDGTAAQFSVLDKQICGTLTTLFCIDNKKVLIGSTTGIFFAPTSTSGEAQRNTFVDTYFPGFPERLRGNSINDFFIVGYRFFIAHYNGASWQQYTNFQDDKVILRSVAQKGNLVIGVGELYDPIKSKAVIIFGKRSN